MFAAGKVKSYECSQDHQTGLPFFFFFLLFVCCMFFLTESLIGLWVYRYLSELKSIDHLFISDPSLIFFHILVLVLL